MDLIEVTITASGSEGQGIGSLPSGKTCFVAGVFPGEVCLCRIENETSKYAVCDAVELTVQSPDRIAPFRPADEVSGGLPFACLSYEAQLKFKETRVRDCLTRIGGFDEALLKDVFKPVLGADSPYRYRNHMQYAIRDGKIGLLCGKSDALGDYDGRLIEYEIFEKIKNMASVCFDRAPTRLFDGLVLRGSLRTKQVLVEFVSSADGPHEVILRDAERYFETTHLFDNIYDTCEENGYVLNGFLFRISPSKVSKRTSFLKYWILVLAIMASGYAFTAGLSRLFDAKGFAITLIKIVVETALFFFSYGAQKKWIFKAGETDR